MDSTLTPAVIAMVGGGVLLYLGLRRGQRQRAPAVEQPAMRYCDIRATGQCGPNGECVAVYDQGQAPPGYENIGVCFQGVS